MTFLKGLFGYIGKWFNFLYSIVYDLRLYILPFFALPIIKFLPWDSGDLVRYSGLVLELLGLYTVIVGHTGKRELFEKPTFFEIVKNRLSQHPRWKAVVHTIGASSGSAFAIGGSARVSAWHGAKTKSTIDRLEAIEKNLLSLRNELHAFEQEVNVKHSKLVKDNEVALQSIESSLLDVRTKLEDLAVKGMSFEVLGIYWLFCGLVFSSLASEISTLLNLIFGK